MNQDKEFLQRAVAVALSGIENGGGPFGAVIAKNGEIIAESNNKVVISHDPTAHAEVLAIREAALKLKTHDLSECTLYTSCEPCPMCLGAVYWAGIRKVFYACDRNDAEKAGFNDSFIYNEILLEPSERKVVFRKADDSGGSTVFAAWNAFEKKIPY